MNQVSRLLQLLSDVRLAALFATSRPVLVLDAEGNLVLANGASLSLLRAGSRADAAAAIEAARGPLAAILRQLMQRTPDSPAQLHTLPLPVAGTRKPIQFSGTRIALSDGTAMVLLSAVEPVGEMPAPAAEAAAIFEHEKEAFALLDLGGKRIYANDAAAALMGAADSLAEIVPGLHTALADARANGAAELSFGVLRVLLRRTGGERNPFIIALFSAPERVRTAYEYDAEAEPHWTDESQTTIADAPPVNIPSVEEDAAKSESEESAKALAETDAAAEEGPSAEPAAAASAEPTATASAEPTATASAEPAPVEQKKQPPRTPGRFVWQTDADGRFTNVSSELADVVGSEAAAIAGMNWNEAGALIGIEGIEAVSAAVERRDTWSGVTVTWPVEGGALVRPVDLAALPVFDRERRFLGYRGFGVFRDPLPRPAAAPIAKEKPAPPRAEPREPVPIKEPHLDDTAQTTARPVFGKRPENVVPLYKSSANEPQRPTLTQMERHAFREIAKAIGSRMKHTDAPMPGKEPPAPAPVVSTTPEDAPAVRAPADGERAVLDRLPIGVIVHRAGRVLYMNRTLLDWVGLESADALQAAGGLDRLFSGAPAFGPEDAGSVARPITIRSGAGEPVPVEACLLSASWDGEPALAYVLQRADAGTDERTEAGALALRDAEATARETRAILDTATDGVALLDREGRVLGMNRSAEALFGFDSSEIEGRNFTTLFAPESHRAAADYLDGLAANGVASVLNDGREVIGRVREGGLIPLFMTLGRVGETGQKFCAVFRDITQWKRAEEELVHARRQAERASSAKSEFLAKISHEIRTPLNAIIGFAEVMMEERLGPIGNDRYREYLKDIHTSGEHLISLVNDLLDLSKIEAGKLDLAFSSVDLNEIASQSMALMQPEANRERIIIRTALSSGLPPVVADARSIRQIVLNLLSNSIRFTPPGGQVIVSTTLTDDGEVHLRVRDTGIGMSESEIKTALEPFRQIATAGRGKAGGTGLGLPLTKALVEANRASFSIKSTVNAGTLVEVAFPSTRVLAE